MPNDFACARAELRRVVKLCGEKSLLCEPYQILCYYFQIISKKSPADNFINRNLLCLKNQNIVRRTLLVNLYLFPIEAATLFTIEPFEHNEVRSRFTKDKKEKTGSTFYAHNLEKKFENDLSLEIRDWSHKTNPDPAFFFLICTNCIFL